MKTYFDIIRDVSNLRWSIVDPDPGSFVEVQKAVKMAICQAHSFIWSLDDFPFKCKKEIIRVSKGQNAIHAPKGIIENVWIEGAHSYLKKISADQADFLSAETNGYPHTFWLEYGDQGMEMHLYPTPSTDMILSVRFLTNYKALSSKGELKHNLEEMDDRLNLPQDSTIEDLYMHCLNTKSMEYLIADKSDENYQPYQKEFQEAYQALLRLTSRKIDPRLLV